MDSAWARRPELRALVRVALGLTVTLALIRRPAAAGATVLPCRVPVEIDGNLLCDAEVDRVLLAACGAAPRTRPGDVLETRDTCEPAGRLPPADLAALSVPVNVNRDTVEDLTSLPGIGPVIAGRIVAGRPHATLEDLLAVKGIGPVRLSRLRARARVR